MTSRRRAFAERIIAARREQALARTELRLPSAPRTFPDGATSFPIKTIDPETRRLIDDAIRTRRQLK